MKNNKINNLFGVMTQTCEMMVNGSVRSHRLTVPVDFVDCESLNDYSISGMVQLIEQEAQLLDNVYKLIKEINMKTIQNQTNIILASALDLMTVVNFSSIEEVQHG